MAAYSRFLDVVGNVGETLKVELVFSVKASAEERFKQRNAWCGLGNPNPLEE